MERTVSRIEQILAETGAKAIGKNYESGKLSAITFQMEMNGRDFLVRLPADPNAVYESLLSEVRRPREGTFEKLRDQAARTAWKIQQDWLEIELTQIRLRQKEPLQVFLSYVWDGKQTYYHALKENRFKALIPEKT